MMDPTLVTIITSAAIGAVVSAIVSACTTLLGQKWERKSREDQAREERDARKRELLMKSAIDVARSTLERMGVASEYAPVPALEAVLTRRYFGALMALFDTGKLPPELEREHVRLEAISRQRVEARDEYDTVIQTANAVWTGKASPLPRPEPPKDEETDKDERNEKKESE